MLQTVEAIIDSGGQFHFLEPIKFTKPKRALVTFLYDENESMISNIENALLSEEVLGKDWNRIEEDEAWSHLQ
ncbi:hypothetical protein [Candidatus Parabeggiatoa sp. HSG14]|uniref:hypothetical protein n=1 Tax=Candidatus Parabeggiatoa sp. HSG14 TaxID=3055593 RepID=UPI0025A7339B|nr:hypothetical protein [Thiotrichales bacterium HSG14]